MPIDPRMVRWEDAPAKSDKIDAKAVKWDDAPADSPKDKGKAAPGWMKGANALFQGATFGFGDELQGAFGAGMGALMKLVPAALAARMDPGSQALRAASLGDAYRMTRDAGRGMDDSFAQDNPLTNMALQAAGGIALPMGPVANALPAGMNPLVKAGIVGAGAGAVGGVGGAGSLADVPMAAARGAAVGGIAGPAAGAIAGGGGAIVNNIRARVSDGAAGDMARRRIAEAIARDDTTTQRMGTRMGKLGDRAVIADSGGENVRNLLDTVAVMPGKTGNRVENLIRDRQAGRSRALIGAAENAMETNGQRMAPTLDEWISLRASDAKPWYDKARQIPIQPDAELQQIVKAADQLGATAMARKIAMAERAPFTLKDGAPEWSMADLDRVKQGIDAQISKSLTGTGQGTPMTRALMDLKSALTAKLDDATGGVYAEARRVYAGPTAMKEAAELGRKAMAMDDASIRQATSGLDGSELEAFRLGAFESLRAKLGRMAGQTEVINMWRDSATREKLQALFPNERAFREFAATAAAEGRLKGLERVGRGSQTARREAGFDDLNSATARDSFDLAASIKTGNPLGVLERASRIYGRVATPEPVRDAIGRSLLTPQALAGPELQSIEQLAAEVAAQRNNQAAASATGGAAGLRALLGL
jgi:hypothetical protein